MLISRWNNLRWVLDAVEDAGFKQLNHVIWKYRFGVFTRKRFVTSHYHLLLLVKDEDDYTFNKPEHYPEDVWLIRDHTTTGRKQQETNCQTSSLKDA